jgi:DNA-binding NtrC family response regulator
LIEHIATELGQRDIARRFSKIAHDRLASHDWPGNVRELRNVIAAAIALAPPAGPIEVDEYVSSSRRSKAVVRQDVNFKARELEFERDYFRELRAVCEENISEMRAG